MLFYKNICKLTLSALLEIFKQKKCVGVLCQSQIHAKENRFSNIGRSQFVLKRIKPLQQEWVLVFKGDQIVLKNKTLQSLNIANFFWKLFHNTFLCILRLKLNQLLTWIYFPDFYSIGLKAFTPSHKVPLKTLV